MSAYDQQQPPPPPAPAQPPREQVSAIPPPPTSSSSSSFAPPPRPSVVVKPATTELQRPPTPPPSLPSADSVPLPAPTDIPPPPAVPLPSHIVQPPQLQHVDSASSVVAEPPTPAPLEQPPHVNGNNGYSNGSIGGAEENKAGLGMGMHGEGQPGQSAVDVLADVAMGEAAMDLAGFAAGASTSGVGSADVKEEVRGGMAAVAEPSPPLKRSYEESDEPSAQQSNGGYFGGATASGVNAGSPDERETKRPRVEEVPSAYESAPQPQAQPQPTTLPSVSIQPPADSPAPVPQEQHQPPPAPSPVASLSQQPSASPAPTAMNESYDPALGAAPTSSTANGLAPSPAPVAPSPVPSTLAATPSAAPTMSPSDLHHFPGGGAQPQPHQSSASPLPPPSGTTHEPSPVPPPPAQPQLPQQASYASPHAYGQQQQPSPYPPPSSSDPHQPSASASPYPPPVTSTSAATPQPQQHQSSPFPPPAPGAVEHQEHQQQQQQQQPSSSTPNPATNPNEPAGPPPAEPIPVMTKEQQKHAINLVRNLKRNKNASPFLKPVDHIALHIPDYYKIITQPMDLGSVEGRLQATGKAMTNVHKVGRIYGLDYSYGTQPGQWEGQVPEGFEPKGYRTVLEFKEDLDRIWNNCFRYNGPRDKNPVSAMAGLMMDAAEKSYRGMPFAPAVSPYPPRHVSPEIKREPRPAPGFVPTIRRDDASSRPKREIHAPVKDLYLDSADPSLVAAGGYQQPHPQGMMMQQHHQMPQQKGRNSKRGPQEQLRYCKETIKELFKKTHESYAYPFYQPVDLAAYPTYSQYVSRPMDLSTIRSKLEHNQYPLPPYDAFESDVRQIFENCFAFNPAGTIVHDWGRQLEAVFEIKWADRPLDDGDDFSDDDGLNVMEQQLQMLAANIEQMRQNKKAQKEAKRFQQQQVRPMMPHHHQMPVSMVPKPPKKHSSGSIPQQGGYNPYGGPPRAPAPKKSRPSGGGGGGGHKKKKRRDDDSDDYYEDDGGAYYGGSGHVGLPGGGGGGGGGGNRRHVPAQQEEYVDFEMKRELAVKIVTFEGEQLQQAIEIIRRGRPDLLGAADQEVELDIDQLDQRTLVALYRFVCPGAHVPVQAVEKPPKPSKQQTSNKQPRNQRKNLDEEKEAERIEMMEQQLRAFEKSPADGSTAAGGTSGSALPPTPGAQAAGEEGGGGDQASSDSSDEASSDSESDED